MKKKELVEAVSDCSISVKNLEKKNKRYLAEICTNS